MTIDWNNNGKNNRGSFDEHAERMAEFRRSHGNVIMVNAPRRDQAVSLEVMQPLRVRRTTIETGGSALLSDTIDWSVLVPVLKVAHYKLSQN